MKIPFLKSVLASALLVFHISASSEDTDLFVGLPPNPSDLPNVLIVLDNTGNWNTAFTNEKAALKSVLDGLPDDKFRVGLMMYGGPDGGYVRAAVRTMNATNKPVYSSFVNSLHKTDDRASSRTLGRTMSEAYRYLMGQASTGEGAVFERRDYTGNTSGTAESNAIYALAGNALNSAAATTYTTPIPGCKTYIIYIGNSVSGGNVVKDNSQRNTLAEQELQAAGGDITQIPISPSAFQDNVADEWTRFMKKSSLGVRTYTIDVNPGTGGNGPANSALLKSMAGVSSGKYFAVNSETNGGVEIVNALNAILSEIQSVNSVFASVSLPVSVNTQGTYRNQVYIGMFRPDADAAPRWAGNLKQYKLGYTNDVLELQDADSNSAINSSTGFITECARSFWTPSTLDTYWTHRPLGGCLSIANSDSSNYPDGNIVDKGAQAYMLRTTTARTLKTCSPVFGTCAAGGTTALSDFNTANSAITKELLGAADTAERDALINWAKGLDVDDEDVDTVKTSEMRPSSHGDVVHSRPVAINFGTENSPKVVVFYGGNDGVLRAINGNRSAKIEEVDPGKELWAFVPPEFYSYIKRIRDNTTQINYPGNPVTSPTPLPKPYGIDGPVAAYRDASNTWLYTTMRRGGRALYAFNVNPSNPADIKLKWKKGCPNPGNDTDCTTGFSGIGQTWSSPKTLTAPGYGSGETPLLVMGGGYDRCEDKDANDCTSSSKGKYVYVMDANTGALLNTLPTDRGVIADIFVVPDEDTGKAKHAYAADLGGNVYRINIGTAAPEDWTITKIASLGCDTIASCAANRKFMFAPDVLEDNGIYTLLLGSGDREKPLNSRTYPSTMSVANHFFMLKDKPSDAAWLSSESTNCDGAEVICKASLYPITDNSTPTSAELSTKKGWYLGLRMEEREVDGVIIRATEQVVTSAITVFDVVTFSTHIPALPVAGACASNLGTASVYNINYKDAKSANGTGTRYQTISGGGLPPSPVAGMVTLDNGSTVPFCIGCNPDSPLEGGDPPGLTSTNQPKARVYWYIQK
jgi:type IV pilus assembly protein PilY1